MKINSAPTASSNAVREAALKVAKLRRIVEAEEKLAHAAKVRFKGAKKTWKQARKAAKRSAKKLNRAEEQLAALAKQFKRAPNKPKPKRHTRPTRAKSAAKQAARPIRRKSRRPIIVPPRAITPEPETGIVPAAGALPPPTGEPMQG